MLKYLNFNAMNKVIIVIISFTFPSLFLYGCGGAEKVTIIQYPAPEKPKPAAIKKRSYISGDKLICIYSRMGEEEQIILNSSDVCPLNFL